MKGQKAISSSSVVVSDHLPFVSAVEAMRLNNLVTSEQKMMWLIANALGTDLNTSVQLSMKAVSSLIIFKCWIY